MKILGKKWFGIKVVRCSIRAQLDVVTSPEYENYGTALKQ